MLSAKRDPPPAPEKPRVQWLRDPTPSPCCECFIMILSKRKSLTMTLPEKPFSATLLFVLLHKLQGAFGSGSPTSRASSPTIRLLAILK